MTRKELEDLGLSKEQADSVIKINGADLEAAKAEPAAEIKGLGAQIADRDKQLEAIRKASEGHEGLKQQVADLQAENAKAKEAHESEMNQLKVDFAVDRALAGANAKNAKAARALLDLAEPKLDKDGSVKGLQEQIDALSKNKETAFLFEAPAAAKKPNFKGFQPGASEQQKPEGGSDASKMGYDELCAYLAENPDADLSE